jgi:hypothetical protein
MNIRPLEKCQLLFSQAELEKRLKDDPVVRIAVVQQRFHIFEIIAFRRILWFDRPLIVIQQLGCRQSTKLEEAHQTVNTIPDVRALRPERLRASENLRMSKVTISSGYVFLRVGKKASSVSL